MRGMQMSKERMPTLPSPISLARLLVVGHAHPMSSHCLDAFLYCSWSYISIEVIFRH